MPRGSTLDPASKGELTRRTILEEAVQIASERGLEGLSIGTLAEATGMSKAGLFAHFGSKEELQLATLHAAREVVTREVFQPAFRMPRGLPRLQALCDRWLNYAEKGIFRGGCPFTAASTEFDGRPGRVRDFVAETLSELRRTLARLVREAKASGELDGRTDPEHLGFEILALMQAANNGFQLYQDREPLRTARAVIRERLKACAASPAQVHL